MEAMRDGQGSQADLRWRVHARQCPECQATLRLMDLLDQPPAAVAPEPPLRLVAAARRRFSQEHRRVERISLYQRLLWIGGIAAAVALVFTFLMPMEWLRTQGLHTLSRASGDSVVSEEAFDPAMGSGFLPLPGETEEETTGHMLTPAEAAAMPDVLPGMGMDRAIRGARQEIHRQMDELNELIDHDLTSY